MTDHDTFLTEYSSWVDRVHQSTPDAAAPPADLWQRILAQANLQPKEDNQMSAITAAPEPMAREIPTGSRTRPGFGHYLNLAATIALVLAVAVAGWFATMQLNQPGNSNGPFAFLVQMDESATCDVQPMTVDEVMNIVENPYRYMAVDSYPIPRGASTGEEPWLDEYHEVMPKMTSSIRMGNGDEPTQTAFDHASAVISRYIACMQQDGTVAMMLRFSDPFSIQHHVRTEFPFYRSEDQVREYVAEWMQSSEVYHSLTFDRLGEQMTFRQTNDKTAGNSQIHDFGLGFDQIMYIGTEVYDENGDFVGTFYPDVFERREGNGEVLNFGVLFTLLHSKYTGQWYVVTEGEIFSSF